MKAWEIVGYTYNADNYCSGSCVIDALPTGSGERYDGWKLAHGVRMSTEDNLDEIAAAFGIDRNDEYSYDSSEFPKVIFASQLEGDERCAACGGAL